MVKTVEKRDGKKVSFNREKIESAILKAYEGLYELDQEAKELTEKIAGEIERVPEQELSVEQIQDLVEKKLMSTKKKDVAKAYINYRYKKEVARNYSNDFIDAIKEKLGAENVQNQNANVDEYSFGGRIGEASGVVTKRLALDYIISSKSKQNHENNEIYIHDLDNYYVGSHNCLSIPFDDLLANGFNTRQTDVRPAQSVNTAFQLVAVIFQLQSLQQFGGVSATHLDWTMVPYVRKSFAKHYKDGLKYIGNIKEEDIDYEVEFMLNNAKDYSIEDEEWKAYNHKVYEYAMDMTVKETYQAVEGMYHNLK